MDVALLIDSIVRQTTVLIAQLATARGARTPLSDVAEQVFRDLAEELHRQGVSRKVAADMFGMALRSYRRKLQRLAESRTVAGRSLWEAVHEYVTGRSGISRSELLRRFHRDDEVTLKAVLTDLVESALLYRAGRGAEATYRAVDRDELSEARDRGDPEGRDTLLWGALYRLGESDRVALSQAVPLSDEQLDAALGRLVQSGRVKRTATDRGARYRADNFVVPLGSPVGWEAAVYDHFQAVVGTVIARLRSDTATAAAADRVGGSTFTFEIWPGHPLEETVLAELGRQRAHLSDLRARVAGYNESARLPRKRTRVVVYAGQNAMEMEDSEDVDESM